MIATALAQILFVCFAIYGGYTAAIRITLGVVSWIGRWEQSRVDRERVAAVAQERERNVEWARARESRREWNDRAAQSLIEEVTARVFSHDSQTEAA